MDSLKHAICMIRQCSTYPPETQRWHWLHVTAARVAQSLFGSGTTRSF